MKEPGYEATINATPNYPFISQTWRHKLHPNMYGVVLNSSGKVFFLPARASEQGNVIGLVSVYIYIVVIKKKCN